MYEGIFMTVPILQDFPHSFDSERLTIRCPLPGDGAELLAAIVESQAELAPWLPWAVGEQKLEQVEENVRRGHARFLTREDLWLMLFLRGTNTVVGGSGLHRIDWAVPKFEIGYWVRTRFARQGYIKEAVTAVSQFAFETLGAKRVEIRCDANNVRSAAIPPKVGFVHEATLRQDGRHHVSGDLRDTMIFAKIA